MSDPEYAPFPQELLADNGSHSQMAFCIKNYENPFGLSTLIHSQPQVDRLYDIKGPMGHGLQLQRKGIHVAFAAGTGALCFVDLVAYLLKVNTGAIGADPSRQKSIQGVEDDEKEDDLQVDARDF